MERFIIILIVLIFFITWSVRERGENFKYLPQNSELHKTPAIETFLTVLKPVNEMVNELYEEILNKFNLRTLSILNNYNVLEDFEARVRKWIVEATEEPKLRTKDSLLQIFIEETFIPADSKAETLKTTKSNLMTNSDLTLQEQERLENILSSQLPRISRGPMLFSDEIDIQELPRNEPWQWVLNDGPIRPWEPRWPVMNVPKEPIPIIPRYLN